MSTEDDFLGLGSLWEAETLNAEFDQRRERERERRAAAGLREALTELADIPISIVTSVIDRRIHVRRMGVGWVDGTFCGDVNRVWVPYGAIARATTELACLCAFQKPAVFDRVPVGTVLREWERRARVVTVITRSNGTTGRICGVWRDALGLFVNSGRVVVPLGAIGLIVERSEV